MESPITFSGNGRRLFGMLHEPAGIPASFGVVFLNAGPQNRVGPQRIYVHAARRLAAAGLTCLRIDLPGVGESEGPFPENNLDCHDPADVHGAIDVLLERRLSGVAVLGLCVGARVATRAALADPRIDAVVAWSPPIVSGSPDILAAAISKAAARGLLNHWRQHLWQPKRWARYFRSRDARKEVAGKLKYIAAALFRRTEKEGTLRFVKEMETLFRSPRPVFIAYGERDVGPREEFTEHLAALVGGPHRERRVLVVPGADHTYSAIAARNYVIDETLGWLLARTRTR